MNENTILTALELIENPYLISFVLLVVIVAMIYQKSIMKLILDLLSKKKNKKQRIEDLLLHNVFVTLDRATHEVKVMKFYTNKQYDKVKSRMCYDFTKSKSRTCAMHMKNLARFPKLETMSNIELKNFIIEAQNLAAHFTKQTLIKP